MHTPSIEALLSRTQQNEDTHPIARRLNGMPVLGGMARAWVRATRTDTPKALWVSLPPVAAA